MWGRPTGEDPIHDLSAVHDHRPNLLSVDRLRGRSPAMPDQAGDLLNRDASVGEQRDEAVPELARPGRPPRAGHPVTAQRSQSRALAALASLPQAPPLSVIFHCKTRHLSGRTERSAPGTYCPGDGI